MWHGDQESCDGILLQTFVIHSRHRPWLLSLCLFTVPGVDLSLLLKSEKFIVTQWETAALIFKASIDQALDMLNKAFKASSHWIPFWETQGLLRSRWWDRRRGSRPRRRGWRRRRRGGGGCRGPPRARSCRGRPGWPSPRWPVTPAMKDKLSQWFCWQKEDIFRLGEPRRISCRPWDGKGWHPNKALMSWRQLYDPALEMTLMSSSAQDQVQISWGCHPSLRRANMMRCSIHIPILMMLLTLHQPTPKSHWPEMVTHYLELVEFPFFQNAGSW